MSIGPPLCGGLLLLLAMLFAAGAAVTYRTGPPAAHTGGFGEPTCYDCHFDGELNAPGGGVALRGLPARYQPDSTYVLDVVIQRNGLGGAGFQLAIRIAGGPAAGRNAGSLAAATAGAIVVRTEKSGVEYAQHNERGTRPVWPDSTVWRVTWTAPPAGSGRVIVHIAANAANGDDSASSDQIYTTTVTADEARYRTRPSHRFSRK